MTVKIELSEPDARILLTLLRSAPDAYPDVISELEIALGEATEKCRHGEIVPRGSVDNHTRRSDYCDECQAEMVERDRILRNQP